MFDIPVTNWVRMPFFIFPENLLHAWIALHPKLTRAANPLAWQLPVVFRMLLLVLGFPSGSLMCTDKDEALSPLAICSQNCILPLKLNRLGFLFPSQPYLHVFE